MIINCIGSNHRGCSSFVWIDLASGQPTPSPENNTQTFQNVLKPPKTRFPYHFHSTTCYGTPESTKQSLRYSLPKSYMEFNIIAVFSSMLQKCCLNYLGGMFEPWNRHCRFISVRHGVRRIEKVVSVGVLNILLIFVGQNETTEIHLLSNQIVRNLILG